VKSRRAIARPAAVASITAADAELEETLDNLDSARNYIAWIFEQVEPHLGKEVLEVGAGHGTFTGLLSTSSARVVAMDVSQRCTGILRARFADDPRVTVLPAGRTTTAPDPDRSRPVRRRSGPLRGCPGCSAQSWFSSPR
jgi:predicted RNA methylase